MTCRHCMTNWMLGLKAKVTLYKLVLILTAGQVRGTRVVLHLMLETANFITARVEGLRLLSTWLL